MNPTETIFLAAGLVLGTALGAALWQVVRSTAAPRREVRLTIAPNAVPARHASTLAVPGGRRDLGPLPGSPDGDAYAGATAGTRPAPAPSPPAWSIAEAVRTPVPNAPLGIPADAIAVPVIADRDADLDPWGRHAVPAAPVLVGVASAAGADTADRARAALPGPGEPPSPSPSEPAGMATGAAAQGDPDPGVPQDPGGPQDRPTGPCADERRLVDERCAVATAAREEARRTAEALRDAQRTYDSLQERVARAHDVADPRRVAEAKGHLHGAFRSANDAAAGPEEAEAAAREWLDAVNALNTAVRDATRLAELGGAELRSQLPALDRLGLEADAARIAADNAAEACQAARERLASCEELAARVEAEGRGAPEPAEEHPFDRVWPADEPALVTPPAPDELAGVSSIIRVLRGDRDARERIVAALAGADDEAPREWRLRLGQLVDAITARAIEDGYLDLPDDDPFWGLFDPREARDIVGALSALGFRYDGMHGFADDRVPATRDLSLAVGYAGLDRMRIRTWPREEALGALYARASVSADEWLVDAAGDLSLGRMVDALGSRAAALADVWNAWGRVRPVLLAE